MEQIQNYVIVTVALACFVLSEGAKKVLPEDKQGLVPIIAMAMGLILGTVIAYGASGANTSELIDGAIKGIISGGFAVGMFEGMKVFNKDVKAGDSLVSYAVTEEDIQEVERITGVKNTPNVYMEIPESRK